MTLKDPFEGSPPKPANPCEEPCKRIAALDKTCDKEARACDRAYRALVKACQKGCDTTTETDLMYCAGEEGCRKGVLAANKTCWDGCDRTRVPPCPKKDQACNAVDDARYATACSC